MLLDCTLAVALLGPLYTGIRSLGGPPVWQAPALFGAVAVVVGLWIAWRLARGGARAIALCFAASATACWLATDGPAGFGMLWVSSLVLLREFGARAVASYLILLVGFVVASHAARDLRWENAFNEGFGVAIFAAFGAVFALLIARSERAEEALRQTRDEQDATLDRLETANAELRERIGMEQDLVLARERERTAQGLHDVLGHRLTAIGLSLEFAERVRDRDPERAWREVAQARATAAEALAETRRIVRAMHPVELRDLAGTDAFEAIAGAFRSSGIDVRVAVTETGGGSPRALPRAPLLLLLRFVQEGLTNIVRHSDAARADIRIVIHPDRAEAVVEDHGPRPGTRSAVPGGETGGALAAGEFREGFGLRSLRSRAESMGGSFDCGPSRTGFAIRISLPLHEAPATEHPTSDRAAGVAA